MLVSVVIPVFNRRAFIEKTVASVLAQTYAHVEVIIVDDGSTDGSADLVESAFGDRVHVVRLPTNEGRSIARNKGWALAQGSLVAFLDSDDLWAPEKLARQVPYFDDPAVAIVHCRVARIGAYGDLLEKESSELAREFLSAEQRGYDYGGITQTWCRMYTSASVVRRDALRWSGGFDPRLSNFEDYDVLWRIARDGRYRAWWASTTSSLRRRARGRSTRPMPRPRRERLPQGTSRASSRASGPAGKEKARDAGGVTGQEEYYLGFAGADQNLIRIPTPISSWLSRRRAKIAIEPLAV